MSDGKIFKTFLSEHEDEGSTLTYSVRDNSNDVRPQVYSSLRLTDCSKAIFLDFDMWEDRGFDSRLAKIDVLINSLKSFRKDYITTYKASVKSFKQKSKKKKVKDEEHSS